MTKTPNNNYNTPPKGTVDWHIPLNENFAKLDTDVEIRDAEANLGNYEPKQNAKFEATDTGAVYYGNGTSWNLANRKLSSLSVGEIATRSQVPDAIVYEDSSVYRAVGKTGSIANGSDAGQVIQAAVDAAGVGGAIHISSGTFYCDSHIELHESQWLCGAGMYQTILQATANISGHLIQASDNNSSGREEFLRLSEVTIDMDDQGYAGVFWFIAQDCIVERVFVKNAGDRNGGSNGGILLRNSFNSDGTDHWVINNRTENCSNVSIDCGAGGTDPARATVYGNKIFNPNGTGNFTHGISVENIDNSTVANNTIIENDGNGPRWNPALNINAASNTTVVGNTVENVKNGLFTANGPGDMNVYANNTFYNYSRGGVGIKESGAGLVQHNLVIGNTFDANGNSGTNGINIGDNCHADIVGNTFRGHRDFVIFAENTAFPVNVRGNQFYDLDRSIVRIDDHQTKGFAVFANNFFEYSESSESLTFPPFALKAKRGICTGNSFGYRDSNGFQQTLQIASGGASDYWIVSSNYVRGGGDAINMGAYGIVAHNIIDGGPVNINQDRGDVYGNLPVGSESLLISPSDVSYPLGEARASTYVGDGTAKRFVPVGMTPDHVVIQSSDGTLYDVHAIFGTGYLHDTPVGGFSIVSGGFEVGDNSSNVDPNTEGETYTFYTH